MRRYITSILILVIAAIAGAISQAGAKLPVLSGYEQTHCPKVCKGKDNQGRYVIRTDLDVVLDDPYTDPGSRVVNGGSHGEIFSYKSYFPNGRKVLREGKFRRCTPKGNAVTVTYSPTEADPSDDQVVGTTTTDSNGYWEVTVSGTQPRDAVYSVEIAGHTVKYRGKKVKCLAGQDSTPNIVG